MIRSMLAACVVVGGVSATGQAGDGPRALAWHPAAAEALRARALANDPSVADAVAVVRREADAQMDAGPFSVTHKTFLTPSGDVHDYSTLGRYWWPNPDTADGLPWVKRDGQTNPQYFDQGYGDTQRTLDLWRAVTTLSRAYYVTNDEKYAEKAAALVRTWFLDPETRMNPHGEYAARFPGHWDGIGLGIHGMRHFADLFDTLTLIEGSAAWTSEDDRGMKQWVNEFLDWVLTSKNGKDERAAVNNHGVGYDWVVVLSANYVGREDVCRSFLEDMKTVRIAPQIEPDGSMPHELKRAQPWRYEGYSLEFLFKMAILADRFDIDLWRYETADGRGIRKAFDFLVDGVTTGSTDQNKERQEEVGASRLGPLLAVAARVYDEPRYLAVMEQIGWSNHLRIQWAGPNPHLAVAP